MWRPDASTLLEENKMARLRRESSNSLLEGLDTWNQCLQAITSQHGFAAAPARAASLDWLSDHGDDTLSSASFAEKSAKPTP
jgi:hypothetical protein